MLARPWFKDSIILLPARTGHSGAPEAPSGFPKSPPSSPSQTSAPPTAMKKASRSIAKQCERLLCGDMKRIFLGGKNDPKNVLRSMDSIYERDNYDNYDDDDDDDDDDDEMRFIEVWDYVGGTCFRGFIADKRLPRARVEKTLFLFFEQVGGTQLKPGLMALIELASECFSCDRLVICLERNAPGLHGLVRDLGWVGFELITLSHWVQSDPVQQQASGSFSSTSTMSSVFSEDDITSEKWLFMGMEV